MSDATLIEKLQAAINAARDLGQAARTGASSAQLDDLAGQVIQHVGAFRAALRAGVVHMRSVLPELDYDGPTCLAEGGSVTEDGCSVTCTRCRGEMRRAVERPGD